MSRIFCNYFFALGKPDPPQKVDVLEITKNSAKVGWVKPMRDGGAKIDGYIIDYLEVPEPKIIKESVVGESEVEPGAEPVSPPPPVVKKEEIKEEKKEWTPYTTVKDLFVSVVGLKEGRKYRFRVAARNAMGASLPTETKEAFEIKEQMCKLLYSTFMLNNLALNDMLTENTLLGFFYSGTQGYHARACNCKSRSKSEN